MQRLKEGEENLHLASELLQRIKNKGGTSKGKERNPYARLHLNLCHAVGGWVPHEEFLNLPFEVILSLIDESMAYNKMIEKKCYPRN